MIEISTNQQKYSSFPDIVKFNGQYICVYREGDSHHPTKSWLMMTRSSNGENWKKRNFAYSELDKQGFVFNCPKFSIIEDTLWLVCDTKTSQKERFSEWEIVAWYTKDGKTWNGVIDFKINGMVPDKIIKYKNQYIMGYHIIENEGLVQMAAHSVDCKYWRDRTTVAISNSHQYCEGSIVNVSDSLICFLRDNRNPLAQARYTISHDGYNWTEPVRLGISAQRIVAGIKKYGAHKGEIIATYRDTLNRTISLFALNLSSEKLTTYEIDSENKDTNLYDFGYTGWVENEDGSVSIVYYIKKNNNNPVICYKKLEF